ncbi:MAG: C4-type zinc ribbon domain-containing protein [Bacteroidota bacterium]
MLDKEKVQLDSQDVSIEEKLFALYSIQLVDSQIDKIRILRGELPLEVQDLEDEVEGLDTRVKNFEKEIAELEKAIAEKKSKIIDSESLIKKYNDDLKKIKNNREFDSLSKEIEFQTLEIELYEKQIRELVEQLTLKQEVIDSSKLAFEERNNDLNLKNQELEDIITDTQKEEEDLLKKSAEISHVIEKRLLSAYRRIRKNARNGLAVVTIERNACGGCYNKIPPQRQLDIGLRKKIIVCEYCGRILIDNNLANEVNEKK